MEKVIEEIRKCPSEEEVIDKYDEYLCDVKEKIKKARKTDRHAQIERAITVAEEAARRVSKPDSRIFLSRVAKELGGEETIILPPYEDIFQGSRKWTKEHSRYLKEYIKKICEVLNELRDERIEKWVTIDEICKRTCEAAFVVEFILKQLAKVGMLEFRRIELKEFEKRMSITTIYIKKKCPVNNESMTKLLSHFEKRGEIPYNIVQVLPKNHLYR